MTKIRLQARKLSYGGGLPSDPLAQQQQTAQVGQQLGQALPQIMNLIGSGGGAAGAAGGAGAASGVAGAAGPIGLAVAGGAMVNGLIKGATTDADGFNKTNLGSKLFRSLGDSVDPISRITTGIGNLGRKDLTATEKVLSFVPGIGALATDRADESKKAEMLRRKNQQAINESEAGIYSNVAVQAKQGVRLVPHLGGGGKPAPAPKGQPVRGNPEAAKKYYDNVLPAMQGLIGNKHDEVYTDPATGRAERANSCLSFACTVQEVATDQPIQRSKQNLYNPEFTRTAEQQGWVPIDIKDAKPGDRFQSWQPVGTATANEFKVADLGGKQLIPGRVPVHMTVFGGWAENGKPSAGNPGIANLYQDGHQYRNADMATRPIRPDEWVVYRFFGANGQPTNDPKEAVAVNPAVKRAEGGTLRLRPRQPAAESTGVARPQLPAPVLRVDDVRDPGAREFLKARTYNDGKHFYQNRLLVEQYQRNGAPSIDQNPALQRANFTHSTNTMHIQPNDEGNYLAELAHAQQRVHMGWPLMNLKKALVDNRYEDSSVPGRGRYAVPGTLEHEAHSVIEPQLQQQYQNMGHEGVQMQRALRAALPGSFPQHAIKQQLKLTPRKLASGGSLIASGALHSEKHGIEGQGIGSTGVPIINVHTGERAAEIERNELVLGDTATARLEKLRLRHQRGDKLAAGMAGKLLKTELRENTQPNERYLRRLKPKNVQQYQGGGNLELLGADGKPLAGFSGDNRVMSQKHTLKLVTGALKAKHGGHERNLGRLAFRILDEQDKRPVVHAKD